MRNTAEWLKPAGESVNFLKVYKSLQMLKVYPTLGYILFCFAHPFAQLRATICLNSQFICHCRRQKSRSFFCKFRQRGAYRAVTDFSFKVFHLRSFASIQTFSLTMPSNSESSKVPWSPQMEELPFQFCYMKSCSQASHVLCFIGSLRKGQHLCKLDAWRWPKRLSNVTDSFHYIARPLCNASWWLFPI